MTNGSLMKVESIAECSPWSILQYFWPALSNNWLWKPIFGLFKSGHFTPVLLYSMRWFFSSQFYVQFKKSLNLCFMHMWLIIYCPYLCYRIVTTGFSNLTPHGDHSPEGYDRTASLEEALRRTSVSGEVVPRIAVSPTLLIEMLTCIYFIM